MDLADRGGLASRVCERFASACIVNAGCMSGLGARPSDQAMSAMAIEVQDMGTDSWAEWGMEASCGKCH